ncbi:MAG TPA: hotdog domain-containing protein [Arachidicoccus sp.]|nr:hotdog domain-containing protein [Arachidicoccus sp.]
MITDLEERIKRSETHMFKTVFAGETNHYQTLFGGTALAIMDDVAFITGTRFCRLPLVTVSTDKVDFKKPIPHGSFMEAIGKVKKVGNTSIQIQVTVYVEYMYEDLREKAIEGVFTMVAVDASQRPIKIN